MRFKLLLTVFIVVVFVVGINYSIVFLTPNTVLRIIASAGGGFVIGAIFGTLIFRNLTDGLRELMRGTKEIAAGDLSKKVAVPEDPELAEVATSFQTMVRELRSVVGLVQQSSGTLTASAKDLSNSAQQMSASAQEISSATEHIAKGAEVQVEGVTRAAARIKEGATSMERIASRAAEVAAAGRAAGETAERGGDAASSALEKMNQVFGQMESSAGLVHGFGERTQKIEKIVEVISGISQQTNLLALNATIEAARAGEYGRGFAVVADEVRKLSEKTQKSAEEITTLIAEIGDESRVVLSSMEQGNRGIREGREVMDTVRESMDAIISATVGAARGIEEITALAEAQSGGTAEMVKTTDEIFRIAEDNAAATEEASAATEELTASMEGLASSANRISELADNLQGLVSRFNVAEKQVP
jgi:methyl-accepting chemotaxis protein